MALKTSTLAKEEPKEEPEEDDNGPVATAKVTGPKLGCSHEAEPHIIIMQSQQFLNVWTSWRCGWLKGTNVIGVYRVVFIDIWFTVKGTVGTMAT